MGFYRWVGRIGEAIAPPVEGTRIEADNNDLQAIPPSQGSAVHRFSHLCRTYVGRSLVSSWAFSSIVLNPLPLLAGSSTTVLYYDYDGYEVVPSELNTAPRSTVPEASPLPRDSLPSPASPESLSPLPSDPRDSLPSPTSSEPLSSPIEAHDSSSSREAASALSRLEINLSRRQLAFYENDRPVKTYPIAVGRQGWRTPVGTFEVRQMIHNPDWVNPFTGEVIAGGNPRNPLGHYWIGFWTDGHNWVGLHGTPNPESVGRAASHGCIRLYNQDIQELFARVRPGMAVVVIP